MTYQKFLKECIASLENLSDHSILSGLGELLDEKQKIEVKTTLRKDTIFFLKQELARIPLD